MTQDRTGDQTSDGTGDSTARGQARGGVEPAAVAVRAALALLVRDEPPWRHTVEDAERSGRALRRRRRTGRALGGLAAVAAAAAVVGVLGGQFVGSGVGSGRTSGPPGVAAGPLPSDPGGPTADPGGPAGIGLAQGFPLGEAFAAVQRALPAGVALGEVPMDVAWVPAGADAVAAVDVPLQAADDAPVRARLVLAARCRLDGAAPALSAAQAAAVADEVCAAWGGVGRPDPLAPVPGPSTPPDPAS